jgi:DNA-binding SARP family transcriptional activator
MVRQSPGSITRKQDQLLAYVALYGDRPVLRLEIAAALWPDRSLALARNRLTESLHYVRRDLAEVGAPADSVAGNRHVVWLSSAIDTDVRRFNEAVGSALTEVDRGRQIELLEEALTAYGDGLLPGLNVDWLVEARERLAANHARATHQLVDNLQLSPLGTSFWPVSPGRLTIALV